MQNIKYPHHNYDYFKNLANKGLKINQMQTLSHKHKTIAHLVS
jgi:hypothetical protein